MNILGMILALVVLVFLTFKGWAPIPSTIVAVLILAVTNGMDPMNTILITYTEGLCSFILSSFVLFAIGALYGKVMGDSKATIAIGYKLLDLIGKQRVILVILILNTVLLYIGINVFVLLFSVYPIMIALCTEAHVPKRLAIACMYFATTVLAPLLPGNATNMNILLADMLGLNIFSAPLWGIIPAVLCAIPGYIYIQRELKKAQANGEHFVVGNSPFAGVNVSRDNLPNVLVSLLPMIILLATIIIGSRVINPMHAVILGLTLATLAAFILFWKRLPNKLKIINEGINSSINPLISVSAIVGFSAAIQASSSFNSVVNALFSMDINLVIMMVIVMLVLSIITANTIGTVAFFMNAFLERFVSAGVAPGLILRLGTLAAIATTAMPHCGGLVAVFALVDSNHKESYKDSLVVGLIIPLIVTIIMTIAAAALT